MQQGSMIAGVTLWLVRVIAWLAVAYGIGFLLGYFTNIPPASAGLIIGGWMVWYMSLRRRSKPTLMKE